MINSPHYIEWQNTKSSPETQVAAVMAHWETRYQLGSAVLLTSTPTHTMKLVQKQWRKLTRQAQNARQHKVAAEDILQTTRAISRMQRVKFTLQAPEQEPDANFYIVTLGQLTSLPANCLSFYATTTLPPEAILAHLPAEALLVAFGAKQALTGFQPKAALAAKVQTEETVLLKWLEKHAIMLDSFEHGIENVNAALDTLLSSAALQNEFLSKTQHFLHLVQLAQPVALNAAQQVRLKSLQQLERHVRVLSPAFLSDHIVDSQSDDSFLLRELSTSKVLAFDSLRGFISHQYQLGRRHLAAALEQQAGFIRL